MPSRTACDLLPETVRRLASISNIIGIKEASGQMTRLQQLLRECNGSMDVFSGDDLTAASWVLAGAKGVISVTANVAASQMAKMCDAATDGEHATCMRIQEQLMQLHRLMFVESNPIPVKWAMHRMGLMNDEIRLPLTRLTHEHRVALEQELSVLKL